MPATIQQGATGRAVREAQYLLARRHLLEAPDIDGAFGPRTTHAVREYQQSEGLAVDGIVGPATWSALLTGFGVPPTLQQGSSGSVVHRLQEVLNNGRSEFDPAAAPLVVDGQYGANTRAMVTAFQGWGGVPADGIVGMQTWAVSLHAAGQELAGAVGV
jgi:peptidoglycan hydrolase-like protein with peptidoglycan-binding domain